MTIERTLAKDFHSLLKNIDSFSDGQAKVTKWDDEYLGEFEVTISPNDGYYKHGEFVFEISVDSNFPEDPPTVHCKTAIYHPNIDTVEDTDGEICFNLLDNDVWTSQCGLEDIVQGLLFLLYNPNFEDPLCTFISCHITPEEFEENVEISLKGGEIMNSSCEESTYYFPPNPGYVLQASNEQGDTTDRKETDNAVECEELNFGMKKVIAEMHDQENDVDNADECEDADCNNAVQDYPADVTSNELDIDDDNDVSDEDMEKLLDLKYATDDIGSQYTNESERVVSWSELVYGAERSREDAVQSLTEWTGQYFTSDVATNSASKELAASGRKCTISQNPTVFSRFYNALQTRTFRRWLV